ncbi:zinc finger protein 1 homolog isoform X1 [Aphis gossypii]|uniref:C2H2-type domain-containing protein n=2 Tax=Aphis gossypii TaxID=80765 RepID=A0A9P0JDH0_APHGO|nr:zinc finger protein 1 homolog isoform X1 [Aphis gossypii]XP_027847992.2 zinc finger protein 1 homolog isoform X1 [Aphis gossypii]XP_050059542.1 zinc finger protein 1 homolog isoform X1 [Aphis gossypii]XP_050059543.1 zinc finger protein 1 homolog isoform X1 [Aphis gossypii]XP_050059545.1 zinc finger protein 1 homolog isoform X1 [Aphis gossypii]XP_050059546.1 zinc finger protein 1 homolog isoform X1 [Aphis gossypii]XP_050059547.1 zinc finger protein 1 homolog isoform X1 [Aphis gossypii]XP_0
MDQSEFAIKNESHHSIKNEDGIYLDIPPLSSVKEEVHQCLDNGDGDLPFLIYDNINNTVQRMEQCVGENCLVKSEVIVLNNLETDGCSFKTEPEDLDNIFQPFGTVVKKETDNFKLEIQYNDKTVKIEKETLEDTVFKSEIVIEKNDILSILKKEQCNTGYHSNLADLPRTIYKELVNCNNKSNKKKSKNKKNIYICDLCHQSFNSKKLLTFHIKYHFSNNDYCPNNYLKNCSSKNTKCKQLKKYIKIKNIFVCTICNKQFNDQSNCRRHTLSHVNTKKFKCNFCKKQFTTKYNLRVHSRLHTGDSPYKCDVCHLKFDRNDKMLTHRRIHDDNFRTYYNCKDCHRQYLHKNSLLRHVKIHRMENIYSCNHCQQPFMRKDSLIVHLRSKHTGEKPYKCQICKKRFFENSVLVRHMTTHNKSK